MGNDGNLGNDETPFKFMFKDNLLAYVELSDQFR